MVARLFSWHYVLVNTIGSLLMGHREWWSAGRCFRPCVAPHQTCLSFNVTSAINTHLFVFLSALRYLESTQRPSHNIGTLAYTHGGAHNTCTFSLHTDRPTMTALSFYRNGPTTLATSTTHRRYHDIGPFRPVAYRGGGGVFNPPPPPHPSRPPPTTHPPPQL